MARSSTSRSMLSSPPRRTLWLRRSITSGCQCCSRAKKTSRLGSTAHRMRLSSWRGNTHPGRCASSRGLQERDGLGADKQAEGSAPWGEQGAPWLAVLCAAGARVAGQPANGLAGWLIPTNHNFSYGVSPRPQWRNRPAFGALVRCTPRSRPTGVRCCVDGALARGQLGRRFCWWDQAVATTPVRRTGVSLTGGVERTRGSRPARAPRKPIYSSKGIAGRRPRGTLVGAGRTLRRAALRASLPVPTASHHLGRRSIARNSFTVSALICYGRTFGCGPCDQSPTTCGASPYGAPFYWWGWAA